MMKFLIAHDRETVSEKISTLIHQIVPDASIDIVTDGASARQCLTNTIYDLLIVDLTLPPIKGKKPDYKVADTLLQELFNVDLFNVPGDIIGLTIEPEALKTIEISLGPHIMALIPETPDGKWLGYLNDKIKYAARAATTRQISINRHFASDALIVTALDEELEPYRTMTTLVPQRHFPNASAFAFADKYGKIRQGITYSIGKSGPARAASSVQSLISFFRPRIVLMSGFCGGVQGKVNLGDLLIFETAYDWDFGKWEEQKNADGSSTSVFKARPNPISIEGTAAHRAARDFVSSDFNETPLLLKSVKEKSLGEISTFNIHLKPCASGSAVIGDDTLMTKIRGLNDAIWGVDMESYGLYYACKNTHVVQPEFICMKAVADFCNGGKHDKLHLACSLISAAATMEMITKRVDF